MRKRLLIVILDGASGLPVKELSGKTCLEAARTPNIDLLAKQSTSGLMDVVGRGIAPQSDSAAFSLLGYNPLKYYISRGVLEAFGAEVKIEDGELALRCNLTSVKGGKLSGVRIKSISKRDALRVEQLINDKVSLDVPFSFELTADYRGVLIFHDKSLSDQVTNTHPGYYREAHNSAFISKAQTISKDLMVKQCRPLKPEARYTADLINSFVTQFSEILDKENIKDYFGNKINYLLLRDAGNKLPSFPSFHSKYKLLMTMIASMPVELGVAKMIDLEIAKPVSDDLRSVCAKTIDELDENDAVYVHLKGPDKYAHLKDAKGKVKAIEEIDKDFIEPLMAAINLNKTTVCITADHSTPASLGVHSADPVPIIITGESDNTERLTEKECAKGRLGRFEGHELMNKLIKRI